MNHEMSKKKASMSWVPAAVAALMLAFVGGLLAGSVLFEAKETRFEQGFTSAEQLGGMPELAALDLTEPRSAADESAASVPYATPEKPKATKLPARFAAASLCAATAFGNEVPLF